LSVTQGIPAGAVNRLSIASLAIPAKQIATRVPDADKTFQTAEIIKLSEDGSGHV